jgi:hypothetical protein
VLPSVPVAYSLATVFAVHYALCIVATYNAAVFLIPLKSQPAAPVIADTYPPVFEYVVFT